MNLLVIIYMKRHVTDTIKHFGQQASSTFVFCRVSCSSKNRVSNFILIKVVTNSNLTRLLSAQKNKHVKRKKERKKCIQVRSSNLSQTLNHFYISFCLMVLTSSTTLVGGHKRSLQLH